MSDLLDPLWAATLDAVEIDLARSILAIRAHAVDDAKTTRYRLDVRASVRGGRTALAPAFAARERTR